VSAAALLPAVFDLLDWIGARRQAKRSAVALIREAEARFGTNEARRRWVVSQLRAELGVTDGKARDILQAGMKFHKRMQERAARRKAKAKAKAARRG
jgi:hypothetical protein